MQENIRIKDVKNRKFMTFLHIIAKIRHFKKYKNK